MLGIARALGRGGADGVGGRRRLDRVRAAPRQPQSAHRPHRTRRVVSRRGSGSPDSPARRSRGASSWRCRRSIRSSGAPRCCRHSASGSSARRRSSACRSPDSAGAERQRWLFDGVAVARLVAPAHGGRRRRRSTVSASSGLRSSVAAHRSIARCRCARIRDAGHQDDLRRLRQALQLGADLEAIHLRHDQIEEDDLGMMDGGDVERLAPRASRSSDGVALVLEPRRDQPDQQIGIVSDEHAHRCAAARRRRRDHRRPHALTFFALVEGAGVFVAGEHRIGAAARAFVHNQVGIRAASASGRYGKAHP